MPVKREGRDREVEVQRVRCSTQRKGERGRDVTEAEMRERPGETDRMVSHRETGTPSRGRDEEKTKRIKQRRCKQRGQQNRGRMEVGTDMKTERHTRDQVSDCCFSRGPAFGRGWEQATLRCRRGTGAGQKTEAEEMGCGCPDAGRGRE